MSRLTDPEVLALFLEALGNWGCRGFIEWKRLPADWLRDHLPGCGQTAIGRLMYEHVLRGGEIDQVKETREPYRDFYEHHYDFIIPIGNRLIYIETTLDSTRTGPTVTIVNTHDA
jgi:hypothetical protein